MNLVMLSLVRAAADIPAGKPVVGVERRVSAWVPAV
jgi:hypothetical protein